MIYAQWSEYKEKSLTTPPRLQPKLSIRLDKVKDGADLALRLIFILERKQFADRSCCLVDDVEIDLREMNSHQNLESVFEPKS